MAATFGIFILAELPGEAGEQVRALQQRFDPKLGRLTPPHVTLAGSSGVGPIPTDTPVGLVLGQMSVAAGFLEGSPDWISQPNWW